MNVPMYDIDLEQAEEMQVHKLKKNLFLHMLYASSSEVLKKLVLCSRRWLSRASKTYD